MTVSYAKTGKESRTSAGVSPEDARAAAAELNGAAKDARQAAAELRAAGKIVADGIDRAIEATVNAKIKEAGEGMDEAFTKSLKALYTSVNEKDMEIRDHLSRLLGHEDSKELLAYFARELGDEMKEQVSESVAAAIAEQLPVVLPELMRTLVSHANDLGTFDLTLPNGAPATFVQTGPSQAMPDGRKAVPVLGVQTGPPGGREIEIPADEVPAFLTRLAGSITNGDVPGIKVTGASAGLGRPRRRARGGAEGS